MFIGYIYVQCGDSPDFGYSALLEKIILRTCTQGGWWERVNESVWMVPGTVSVDD